MSTPAFKTEKVSDRITRIYAFSTELMYLVEGEDRAALLDTGTGIGSLRAVVESLTDKPLIVLLTHGHIDHAMGAPEFPAESVYINHEDKYIYDRHKSLEFRADGLAMMGPAGEAVTEADYIPPAEIESFRDLKEGDRFDLGGVSVEIYACPGHTRGSVVMLIPEERTVLLGDACNSFTFLFEDYSSSVEEYRESLIRLRGLLEGKYNTALSSHGDGVLAPGVIDENIALCARILAREDDAAPFAFKGSSGVIALAAGEPTHGNIVYDPARLTR